MSHSFACATHDFSARRLRITKESGAVIVFRKFRFAKQCEQIIIVLLDQFRKHTKIRDVQEKKKRRPFFSVFLRSYELTPFGRRRTHRESPVHELFVVDCNSELDFQDAGNCFGVKTKSNNQERFHAKEALGDALIELVWHSRAF